MKTVILALALVLLPSILYSQSEWETALASREIPQQADWWKTQIPNGATLISYFSNQKSVLRKVHALEAMRFFDEEKTAEFLKQETLNNSNPSLRRMSARSLGKSRGIKELDFFSELLKHSDPSLRLEAAGQIKAMKTPAADKLFAKYIDTETSPSILKKLQVKTKATALETSPVSRAENSTAQREKAKGADPRR